MKNPTQSRKAAKSQGMKRLCSAISENCTFLAKFSESSFRMTNEKFTMTNSQFRFSALVATGRAGALRLRAFAPLR
jgi:hypothetical protein